MKTLEQVKARKPLGEGCSCVATHQPKAYVPNSHHIIPESWGGPSTPDNIIELCPNTHTATHRLIDEYVRAKGEPSWEIRKHYGFLARRLAEMAWEGRPEKPTYTSMEFVQWHSA